MIVRAGISRRLPLASLFIITLSVAACGIFETRTPDPPSQLSSNFVPPTDPSLVFQNLINAFSDRNSVNYLKCLSDSTTGLPPFHYDPDPQARANYAAVFALWTRQSEQQSFEAMKAQLATGTTMTLQFISLTATSLGADSAQYDARYQLTVPHTRTGIQTVATGRALFALGSDRSRNWAIVRWTDVVLTSGDFTWSDLKGAFGQ